MHGQDCAEIQGSEWHRALSRAEEGVEGQRVPRLCNHYSAQSPQYTYNLSPGVYVYKQIDACSSSETLHPGVWSLRGDLGEEDRGAFVDSTLHFNYPGPGGRCSN